MPKSFDLTMTPDTLLHNHKNCLLKIIQFDFCLVPEIFSLFPVFIVLNMFGIVDSVEFILSESIMS